MCVCHNEKFRDIRKINMKRHNDKKTRRTLTFTPETFDKFQKKMNAERRSVSTILDTFIKYNIQSNYPTERLLRQVRDF